MFLLEAVMHLAIYRLYHEFFSLRDCELENQATYLSEALCCKGESVFSVFWDTPPRKFFPGIFENILMH